MRKLELAGKTFGRLLVIKEIGRRSGKILWLCRCICGKETNVTTSNLVGKTRSCGCAGIEKTIKRNTIHGHTIRGNHSPEYHVWQSMIARCYNPKNKRYPRYGARGITVCKRWLNSFSNFIKDMGRRPIGTGKIREYSLERKNNDRSYKKSNCTWGTQEEQSRNKSDNHWIEYQGKKMILQDWAKLFNSYHSNIIRMLKSKKFPDVYNHFMKCA